MSKKVPSVDLWLKEAKSAENAAKCGMYLVHNGTVRETARARVRGGDMSAAPVTGMVFHHNQEMVDQAVSETYALPGVYYVRVWLNDGELEVGDDIMLVLVGGDTRPHVIDALNQLVGTIKSRCVTESEKN